jgi:hypothetical protein
VENFTAEVCFDVFESLVDREITAIFKCTVELEYFSRSILEEMI